MGHGSNDVSVAAKLLRIPAATAFDYEWAKVQHNVNCRLCRAVVVPDAIPPERLYRYGARGKVRAYEGLKEEYYLADFEPDDGGARRARASTAREPLVVVRTPPEVSLYHRFENDLFRARARAAARRARRWCCRAPRRSARSSREPEASSCRERAIDAQSLIAFADLVISAGGTMNREAVALGTPVYTTFEGRLGAVDEKLLREGRMRRLSNPGRDRAREARRRPAASACGATRACWSSCCSRA